MSVCFRMFACVCYIYLYLLICIYLLIHILSYAFMLRAHVLLLFDFSMFPLRMFHFCAVKISVLLSFNAADFTVAFFHLECRSVHLSPNLAPGFGPALGLLQVAPCCSLMPDCCC